MKRFKSILKRAVAVGFASMLIGLVPTAAFAM